VGEVVALLHNTALSVNQWAPSPNSNSEVVNPSPEGSTASTNRGLNPTAGVRLRERDPAPEWDPVSRTFLGIPNQEKSGPMSSSTSSPGLRSIDLATANFTLNNGTEDSSPTMFGSGSDFLGTAGVGATFDTSFFPDALLDFDRWDNFFQGALLPPTSGI